MSPIFTPHRRQDILFVCGTSRSASAMAIIRDIEEKKLNPESRIKCFADAGKENLNLAEQMDFPRFEFSSSKEIAFKAGPAIRNSDIAIIEGLPCILSDVVSMMWRTQCDLICEIVTETIEDAFSQIRIHFLKHWHGDTAKRAESVRVFFEGEDVTSQFRTHEGRTRLRYQPMNDQVANPGTRDNYHM